MRLKVGMRKASTSIATTRTLEQCMTCSPTYTFRKFWKKPSNAMSSRCRECSPTRCACVPVSTTCSSPNTRAARSPSIGSCEGEAQSRISCLTFRHVDTLHVCDSVNHLQQPEHPRCEVLVYRLLLSQQKVCQFPGIWQCRVPRSLCDPLFTACSSPNIRPVASLSIGSCGTMRTARTPDRGIMATLTLL